jgi:hypothetical protein
LSDQAGGLLQVTSLSGWLFIHYLFILNEKLRSDGYVDHEKESFLDADTAK